MGATFNDHRVPGDKIIAEIKELFARLQDDDRYENGHSYSGGFGMATGISFPSQTFESEAAARDWLQEHAQKWEDALCVTYKDEKGTAQWLIGAWCAS